MKLFDFQLILSLAVSSTVVFLNISNPWASKVIMLPTINLLLIYNIVDLILGIKYYIKYDKALFIHHLCAIGITYILSKDFDTIYTFDIYRISRWGLLAEVTTVFNNIRLLTRKNEQLKNITTNIFAGVFVVGRTIMSIGFFVSLYKNQYFVILAPFCLTFHCLNIYWINQIIRKAIGLPLQDLSIPQWKQITRFTMFVIPIGAIDAMNHDQIYLASSLWLCSLLSFIYHYEINIKFVDILCTAHCIIAYLYFSFIEKTERLKLILCLILAGISFYLSYILPNIYQGYAHGFMHICVILAACIYHRN